MSERIEKTVREMLNEEKWTRAALSAYSTDKFKELDKIIAEAKKESYLDGLKQLCDEHLSHTKNSIIALYIASIISLSKQLLDDSTLVTLINIFIDNHKTQIVTHLCNRVLDYGDSKLALRTLAEIYKAAGNEEIYDIWERLIKIDYDETEIPRLLAEKYEQDGDLEKAIEYYKKSLYRLIVKKQGTAIKEVWSKLVELIPEDIDFFYREQKKISEKIGEGRGGLLMQEVYVYYKKNEDWQTCIDILKLILEYNEKDTWARKEIIDCFKQRYADHSQLEEYLKISNISQSWRNIFEAIADFEKHISFDEGNYVFHRTWGVGRIAKVDNDDLLIDFVKKRGHTMGLKMAITALQTLDKDHIWVLKSTMKRDELAAKVKKNPEWALKVIIRSFDNNCDLKRVKQEIVPSLLTPGEWTSWNTKARKILKESTDFAANPSNIDFYTVRSRPVSIEEKLANEFKAQRNFFARIEILNTFMDNGDTDSDTFRDMFTYFNNFLKAFNQVDEQVISAYLVVTKVATAFAHLQVDKVYNFAGLYEQISDPSAVYAGIKDKALKAEFLQKIKNLIPDWSDEYIKLFPVILSLDILNTLIEEGFEEKVKKLVEECFENYSDNREAVIWLFKNIGNEAWFQELNIDYARQIIVLIHILDITYREIANKRNTTENRRINKQVLGVLFGKDALLENFILDCDEDTVTRFYTFINDIVDLDPKLKMQLRNKILEKYKDFKFFDTEEKTVTARGLIVTAKMLEAKKKELQEIIDIKIPENSKEIGKALELGDLRENAEYKAAREEQTRLNNMVTRLQEEIERAQVFDPTATTIGKVSFGTIVELKNHTSGENEVYTILGPWESNPEGGVISYMSPLGTNLLNHKKGEKLSFTISEDEKIYEILNISAAEI
ncbi:transcription elongation factor GreA [Treponema phagedenis]|uniref:transcription elongation factor GreA n=1 Tax=Treponema phagedenis TaxID=162 RepID=UPI0001F63917|nr:transcription elongation factor GreA [Treponema phagedenis]EFW36507.1 prokaryotic transcription elongation factor, GreA/GreB domain protein [Treponema phagedenis F0421]TYT78727.1 transcription elongation factor GreA [Treponema phagedenis]